MLSHLVVGLVQWLPQPGQGELNTSYACDQIAALVGCDLIVLPELWPNACSGKSAAADARATAEPLDGPRTARLSEAARRSGSWVVAGSVTVLADEQIFNTALVFDREGVLVATHRKAQLYTPLGEHLIYTAGDSYLVVETGDIGNLGVAICFDADFPGTAAALAAAGAQIVAHPCAYEWAAHTWWDRLYPAAALANGLWWVSANQCGTNGGVTQLGGSRILSPLGNTVAQLPRADDGGAQVAGTIKVQLDYAAQRALWNEHCSVLRTPVHVPVTVIGR